METFGFGPIFIGWIKTLYNGPSAKIKVNNEYSAKVKLERGTRQGCPLSPLLFALAMEPLATAIRRDRIMQGFVRSTGEERIALYADDVLLFLGYTGHSIRQAMNIFF